LSAGANKTNLISPRRPGIAAHIVILAKAALSSNLVIDINKNGVSICGTTKPTLTTGETIKVYSDFAVNPQRLTTDDIMTCDVDAVGAGVEGADITIILALAG
jgi:hypothetical protein